VENSIMRRRLVYRADHVGSMLRPQKLIDARKSWKDGILPAEKLRALEDECIREAVSLQERVGLRAVTDGELRRETWSEGFVKSVDGYSDKPIENSFMFTLDDGTLRKPRPSAAVIGKLRRRSGIVTDQFAFLKGLTKQVAKTTIPSTSEAIVHSGDKTFEQAKAIYPDRASYMADVARIYRQEIADLYRLGCRYLQIDDVGLAVVCDPNNQNAIKLRGEDPKEIIDICITTLQSALKDRPHDMVINLHMCRGNLGKGMASGGFQPIAEQLFSEVDIDGFLLEFDTERSGDFAPLQHVSNNKSVALGLISSKKPELEGRDYLRKKIDEAAHYIDGSQLALCPQCGFGTTFTFQPMNIGEEEKKLELIVAVATEIWGGACN
jgi:5-methyltetrahydropteroyltriglutamate--homocysteine methyltransferase